MINKRSYTIQQDRLRCVSLQHSFTLAAVLCTRQSVQSAETDEVSNIVVMIVFNGRGRLVKIDNGTA